MQVQGMGLEVKGLAILSFPSHHPNHSPRIVRFSLALLRALDALSLVYFGSFFPAKTRGISHYFRCGSGEEGGAEIKPVSTERATDVCAIMPQRKVGNKGASKERHH